MAQDLNSSKSLRAGLRAAGRIDRWDIAQYEVAAGYSPQDVRMHCVENAEWQRVRLSMKGLDTVDKLYVLLDWWDKQHQEAARIYGAAPVTAEGVQLNMKRAEALKWATQVQVGNYLGALVRGGQLNDNREIRKAR